MVIAGNLIIVDLLARVALVAPVALVVLVVLDVRRLLDVLDVLVVLLDVAVSYRSVARSAVLLRPSECKNLPLLRSSLNAKSTKM